MIPKYVIAYHLLKKFPLVYWSIVILLFGSILGGYTYFIYNLGYDNGQNAIVVEQKAVEDKVRSELKDKAIELQNEVDKLNAELTAQQHINSQAYQKGQDDAKDIYDSVISDLESTNGGMYAELETLRSDYREQSTALNTATAKSASATKEVARLSRAYAESLYQIAKDGDDAIRQLNLAQKEYVNLHNYTTDVFKVINKYPEIAQEVSKVQYRR